MIQWVRLVLRAALDAWALWRKQKAEKRAAAEKTDRRLEEEAREVAKRINDRVDAVPRPDIDESGDADDPMGVDDFNRGRPGGV